MQAYASAAQIRLIEEAKKAAEEEANAAQPAEQIAPATSERAKDQEPEQEVVAVTEEAEEGLAEQTVNVAKQTVDIDLD